MSQTSEWHENALLTKYHAYTDVAHSPHIVVAGGALDEMLVFIIIWIGFASKLLALQLYCLWVKFDCICPLLDDGLLLIMNSSGFWNR